MDFQNFEMFVYASGKMEGTYDKNYNIRHLIFLSGDKI